MYSSQQTAAGGAQTGVLAASCLRHQSPECQFSRLKASSAPGFAAANPCVVKGPRADLDDDATLAHAMALTLYPLDGSSRPLAAATVELPIPVLAPS